MIGTASFGTRTFGGSTARTRDSRVSDEAAFEIEVTASIGGGSVKVNGGTASFRVEVVASVDSLIQGRKYRLVITDLAGNRYAELPDARMGDMSWELNGPGGFEFSLGQDDANASKVIPIEREAQVWKGDALIWGGPIVRPSANSRVAAFQAQTPEWHFGRRHFGKADRTNYVPHGDFEDGYGSGYLGFGGWGVGVTSPLEGAAGRNPANWVDSISPIRAVTGSRSLRMEQVSATLPKYGITASQYFAWEVDPDLVGEAGDVWTLVAYAYIPAADWRGARTDRGGLGLGRFSTTETVTIGREDGSGSATYPAPIEGGSTTIDELHPRNRWVRHSVTLSQPPPSDGEPELIAVRLHAPNGVIFWDRVSLTLEEALHFEQTDQALIAAGIVEHLQDPAYGKSDLGLDFHTPLTGVKRDRTYLHQEHGKGIEALSEFPQLDDGMDWDILVKPTSRTFRTHYPRKGVDRSAELVFEWGRNIKDFGWAWDGEAASSSVIMLGSGDGSSREEGFAEDPTLFGGITLEDVSVAPGTETFGQIDTLDNRATERLRTVRNPTILEVQAAEVSDFAGREVRLLGLIQTGDLIYVRIHRGVVDVEGVYRIVRMSLNPGSEILTLTLNWWADG